jgi:Zn-dependent peptidase ImmA (M78 family)
MDAEIIQRVRDIIRELALTNRQFSEAIGLDEDKLSKTLNGRRRLSPLELSNIAELSGRTTDWILAGTEPRRMGLAARTQAAINDLPTLGLTLATRFSNAQDVLIELGRARELLDLPSIAATGRFVGEGQAMADWASKRVPEQVLLGDTSRFIVYLEEQFGVDIASVSELPLGCDGLSFQDDSLRLILLATTANWTRKRFTLAHELGHVLWGDARDQILTESVKPGAETEYPEKRANAFAGAFLMPEESVLKFVGGRTVDEHLFHELVMRYKVSPSAMTARLTQLGQLTRADAGGFRRISTAESAQALDRAAESVAESSFASLALPPTTMILGFIGAYLAGEVGVRPLASLTGLTPKEVRSALNEPAPVVAATVIADGAADEDAELAFLP